jgi:hypothetical protein
VYFSQREKVGPEDDSPLTHTPQFQTIVPAYGYTKEDAKANYAMTSRMNPAGEGAVIGDEIWYPPRQPVDVKKLPTPFPAAGLATFVPGRETLLRVKFSGMLGFDEKMFSSAGVDVPAGTIARFLYLFPPPYIAYLENGKIRQATVSQDMVPPGMVPKGFDPKFARVPVVNLDSWINPYDGKGAMVFPGDNATARMFTTATGPTIDVDNKLMYYRMDLMRWVKPQNIYVLRDFFEEAEYRGQEQTTTKSSITARDSSYWRK